MEPGVGLLIVLIVLVLIVAPILAVSAFVRVRRLEEKQWRGEGERDIWENPRLRGLESRVQGVEKALSRLIEQVESGQRALSTTESAATPSAPPAIPIAPVIPPSMPAREVRVEGPREVSAEVVHEVSAPRTAFTPPAPSVPRISYSSERRTAPPSHEDLETVVAGKWLNYVGIVAVLFAVAFFIEYAFDNNWIGPQGRVAIGIAAGALLLAGSAWLLKRGYKYFSEGIAALGAAVLYLSLWGGWHYYNIFTSGEVFAGMVAVTTVMVAVALGRDSQRLALLALIGGFLTPELCSTGVDHEIVLFTYTLILSAGMLALERFRQWTWLPPFAFGATEVYFWGWYSEFYRPEKLAITMLFATAFFVLFAALPVMRARRDGELAQAEYTVTVGNVAAFLLALRQMLWPQNRWGLTAAFLIVAAAHLAVLRMLPEPGKKTRDTPGVRWLFAGLALACISLAIPARLDGQWLTIAWAVEGVVLVWAGARIASIWLRSAGLVFFAIIAMRLIVLQLPARTFLWNERFMTYMISVACFAAACIVVRKIAAGFGEGERSAFIALAISTNVYALIALSLEVWDYFASSRAQILTDPARAINGGWLAQQLALSVLWAIYATGLILVGVARRAAILRWQALTLFAIVVVKVFFFDLSELSRFYRIISFLVLGVLLLGVSFLYQKRAPAHKEKAL